MRKSIYILLLLFSFTTLTSFNTDINQKSWKLEKNSNGIKVYTYTPVGESLKQVKSNFTIKASLSCLLAVISDVPHYTDWISNCSKATLLKKISPTEMLYYSVSEVPWPIANRDLVMKNKIHQNKKTKVVYSISVPELNLIPFKKGFVRVVNIYGMWKLTPLKNGMVDVEYFIKIDPGGSVPDWVINLTIVIGPYETMLNLKEMIKLERNMTAQFDFIEEP